MSRTFARLELSVTQNGNKVKTFTEDISTEEKDVSTLLNALQKAKDSSNEFLTTLVEEDKLNKSGGVVISHSKRKNFDDGNYFENTKENSFRSEIVHAQYRFLLHFSR